MTLFFAGAVLGTILLHGGLVATVLISVEWLERRAAPPGAPEDSLFDELGPVLGALAFTAPFTVLGAAALGRALARQALAPMREASTRTRAARASAFDLSLPVRGSGDEWDELASTLNALLSDARSAYERTRRFTSDAAHELRTPLTIIMGETEVVLRRERAAEEYRRSLEVIQAESRGLSELVEALLTLARADAGQLVTAGEAVDLYLLAQKATQRAERLLAVQARTVQVELSGTSALVRGDPVLLARVLDNLLSNALRHCQGRVRIEVRTAEEGAQVSVVDNGPGVEPSFAPRLFQRFARADTMRGQEGTGLGLALSRTLIEAHGGALTYSCSPAGESVFTVCLPVLPE
ncbi:sensor histidine kinase [Hyalangium minutum]|uniref:histidine kinase n=1 Tax=Hyalangium minutum TaxID=394096 RepID=A0A085W518_9BACT|nr:sensor histidine kinase [Hyalangium minutum]